MNEIEKQELTKKFLEVAKSEIRLNLYKNDSPLEMSASKIGGKPAVPAEFEWPTYTGAICGEESSEKKTRPLSFLAQIDLKEIIIAPIVAIINPPITLNVNLLPFKKK